MSKAPKEDKAAPMKPIALPALPRCDDNNRQKWIQEYDKVESELLKTHVPGTATVTMGLRQLPATWDRTIPPAGNADEDSRQQRMPRARTTDPAAHASHSGGHGTPSPTGSPRRPRSARLRNVSSSLGAATPLPSKNTSEMLRLLFNVIDPPLRFKASIVLDTHGIDLRWLRRYNSGDRTPTLNTIETFRDDPGDVPPINSPRSAIVVLRNGVTVSDLQVKPLHDFQGLATSDEEAEARCQHREERRAALLNSLREEYRELSHALPLFDLLDDISVFRTTHLNNGGHAASADFSSSQRSGSGDRRRHAEYAAERRRERLEAIEAEKKRKLEEAERRRERALLKLQQTTDERRQAAAAKQGTISPRRAEEHEAAAERVAAATQAKFEKAQQKKEMRAAAYEQKQDEARQRALRNAHRMAKNREQLETQRREQEELREAREAAAKQRREAVEREALQRRQQQLEASRHAAELREQARLKAQRHGENIRAEAEAREQRAAERLQAFQSFKATQQRQNASMEAARRQHRLEAAARAEEHRALERQRLQAKQEEEARRVEEQRRRRHIEIEQARQQHRLEYDDKEFLVERQRRALDFKRLLYATELSEKRERAEFVSTQRSHSSMR